MGTDPSVARAVRTVSPTHLPSACTYSQDRTVPFYKVSQLMQQLASAQCIQPAPRGSPLEGSLSGLHSLVHIGLQGKTERMCRFSCNRSLRAHNTTASCCGTQKRGGSPELQSNTFFKFPGWLGGFQVIFFSLYGKLVLVFLYRLSIDVLYSRSPQMFFLMIQD